MKKHILIVDDKIEDLTVMKIILETEGYKVSAAKDGESALKKLKNVKFHLLLLDIMMPKLSGYDLLKTIREKSLNKIKTAYVSIVPKKEADLSLVDGFIQKPFEVDSFLVDVKKLIET